MTLATITAALAQDTTAALVALHNVLTMGGKQDAGSHAAKLLAAADKILADRGVAVQAGKLLKAA